MQLLIFPFSSISISNGLPVGISSLEICFSSSFDSSLSVSSDEKMNCEEIAKHTVYALQQAVPVSMPGVVFLSGGMSEIEASQALNEINKFESVKPWRLTFSYGRALQSSVLEAWKGDPKNFTPAHIALLKRASANSLASMGQYIKEEEYSKSLHEKNYTY